MDVVTAACLGLQQCTVPATNTNFGYDPCYNVAKYLAIKAICASATGASATGPRESNERESNWGMRLPLG